jgi:hypothetical protein
MERQKIREFVFFKSFELRTELRVCRIVLLMSGVGCDRN